MTNIKNFFINLYNIYIFNIKNYFNFKGRCSRKNFWLFCFINVIIYTLILAVSMIIKLKILINLYLLFLIIPSASIAARRFHDSNKSTKLFFTVYLTPVLLQVALYILLFTVKINSPIVIFFYFIVQVLFFIYMSYVLLKKGDNGQNAYGDIDK